MPLAAPGLHRLLNAAVRVVGRGAPNTRGTQNHDTRHAWTVRTLRSLPAGGRILDVGAGEQPYRDDCKHLEYFAQDFAQYDGRGDSSGLQPGSFAYGDLDYVGDADHIDAPDASFDAILCTEVLEHVPDAAAVLREFARLIRPGGHLIMTAPFCSLTHFAPYHFATGFSRYFYQHHLSLLNFELLEVAENGSYFEYLAQELRRLPSIAERYAGRAPDPAEQQAIWKVLNAIDAFAAGDQGSRELLCYGYLVHARKQQD